jgi:hypothetical protein
MGVYGVFVCCLFCLVYMVGLFVVFFLLDGSWLGKGVRDGDGMDGWTAMGWDMARSVLGGIGFGIGIWDGE